MNLCEHIKRQLTSLFECEQREYGTLLRTPLSRPDGDLVEVVFVPHSGGFRITDLGETARSFENFGAKLPKADRIESMLTVHGAAFVDGEILVHVTPDDDLGLGVLRVAQACVDFSSSLYAQRARAERDFEADVRHRIAELRIPCDDKTVEGASGSRYRITQTGDVHRGFRLVNCLSSRNRTYASQLARLTRCMWEDLHDLEKNEVTGYRHFVTVLDDEIPDLWRPMEIKLLQPRSKVVLWSDDSSLQEALGAAAGGASA